MGIIRFIFFVVAFYFLFKVIKYLIRYLASTGNNNQNNQKNQNFRSNGSGAKSRYKDIEEAKYIEIESEPRKDSSTTQK